MSLVKRSVIFAALICFGCVSCGVVKKPGWHSLRDPDKRDAAVSQLAQLERDYARSGNYRDFNSKEQQLLQAWLDGLEAKVGVLDADRLLRQVDISWPGHDPRKISRLIPANRVRDLFTDNKRVRDGVGLPTVVWVSQDEDRKLMSHCGRTYSLTARLSPRQGRKPLLSLFDSMKRDSIEVGNRTFPLAADFSAHSDLFWDISVIDNEGFLGLFRPGTENLRPRLYLTEDYDPKKIPLIFVHGLTSSPVIWAPVGADIRSHKKLREHYQIWHFSYPSGNAWVNTAAAFRAQVDAAHKILDPQNKSKTWEKMIIVGHSMGGLVTRTAVSEYSSELYKAVFSLPVEELKGSEKQIESIRRTLLGEPLSEPSRVIFIATPHRGSSLADWGIIHWISGLILLPTELVQNSFDVLTRNQFAVSSSFFVEGNLPTGLDTLSPQSPFIKAMDRMRVQSGLDVHSIIGVTDFSLLGRRTDGVVPYHSAHLDWANSEFVVPYTHSMSGKPLVKKEIIRLLEVHIKK